MSRTGSRLGNAAVTGAEGVAADVSGILRVHAMSGSADTLRAVPVGVLTRSPWQPRTEVKRDEDFAALVDSVREHGVLEPALARELPGGTLELLAGERRLEASKAAGRPTIPVRVLTGISDLAARAIALTENLARKDLSAWEEAQALHLLRGARSDAGEPVDVRSLAAAAGRSRTVTAELLRIADTITPEVIGKALAMCGGAFVRTPDTLPHRDLYSVARASDDAERAHWLAMFCRGPMAPAPASSDAHTPAVDPPVRFKPLGSATDPRGIKLLRSVETLTPTDAADALAALEPLVKALRRRAKGSASPRSDAHS